MYHTKEDRQKHLTLSPREKKGGEKKLWKPELRFDEVNKEKMAFAIYLFTDQEDAQFPWDRLLTSQYAQHPGAPQVTILQLIEVGHFHSALI